MKNQRLWIGGVAVIAIIVLIGVVLAGNHKSTSNTNTKNTTTSSSNKPTSADIIRTLTEPDGTQYLADANNMPLYTYANDTSDKSNCTGSCLTRWPIYSAANAPSTLPGGISVISRSDGSKQYAYNGLPLYTFSGDSSGKVTGDGIENFKLAKPAAASNSAAPASSAPMNSAPSSSSNSSSSYPSGY